MQDQPANTMSKESKGSPADSVRTEDDVVFTDTFAWNTAGSARVSRGADEGLQILTSRPKFFLSHQDFLRSPDCNTASMIYRAGCGANILCNP